MQIQANAINTKVVRPKIIETTALGAAYLAGLATGFWKSIDKLQNQWQVDKVFTPDSNLEKIKKEIATWKRAIELSKNWNR